MVSAWTNRHESGLFSSANEAFGRLDILVNNAGIYEFAPIEEVTAEHFHRQFNLNVLGLLMVTKEAVKHFGPDGGSIVNLSSGVATLTPPNASVYSATKAAVDAVTMCLSKELASRKIRVNSVNPGMIETEGVKSAGLNEGDMRTWIESNTPAALDDWKMFRRRSSFWRLTRLITSPGKRCISQAV
jgi:3-oxoacyl-[acyl-carrier protein] reductase